MGKKRGSFNNCSSNRVPNRSEATQVTGTAGLAATSMARRDHPEQFPENSRRIPEGPSVAQGFPALEHSAQDHGDAAGSSDPFDPAVSLLPLPVVGLVLVPSGFSTDLLETPRWNRDADGSPGERLQSVWEQREGKTSQQGKAWGKFKQNKE